MPASRGSKNYGFSQASREAQVAEAIDDNDEDLEAPDDPSDRNRLYRSLAAYKHISCLVLEMMSFDPKTFI